MSSSLLDASTGGEVIGRALCAEEQDLGDDSRSGHVERVPVLKNLTSVSSKNKVHRSLV